MVAAETLVHLGAQNKQQTSVDHPHQRPMYHHGTLDAPLSSPQLQVRLRNPYPQSSPRFLNLVANFRLNSRLCLIPLVTTKAATSPSQPAGRF